MTLHFDNIISFITVAEEGSFSSAARKLGKSQSTVSIAVQNLELDLGFSVFNRYPKVRLNDKGERLYKLSLPIVSRYRCLVTTAEQMNISEQIIYRVGIDPLVFNENVRRTLLTFSEIFPNVDLMLVTKPSYVLGEYIKDGKIDLAIGNPYHKTYNDFNIKELYHVNCWWVGHEDLLSFQTKFSSQRILLIDGFEELMGTADIASYSSWKLDDLSTIIELCKAKKGIAFLPEFIIEEHKESCKLKVITDHPDFFGKKIVASLFWQAHSEFSSFNQWIKEQLQTPAIDKQAFITDQAPPLTKYTMYN
ncbi:LysR family transcriptional regulator [Vibrio sp. Vb339]|uniref:LysR family transcriptional regulator n=1 Tax=Vibrio sp. Vb339 TaxID=1192013 RepID=UPI0015535D88|nr:LysR family transcriptional regulator [Vibrio sp. Vb339]